jgi:membrane associated rhomboid family serine protease
MLVVCDINPVRHVRHAWVRSTLMLACVVVSVATWTGWIPIDLVILRRDSQLHVAMLGHILMHGNPWHLAGNLLALWVFADNVEDAMGHLRFIGFVLATGVAGAVAQFQLDPVAPSLIGASSVAAGTMGAYLVLHPRASVAVWMRPLWPPVPVFFPAGIVVGAWVALNIVNALVWPDAPVAWWGHIVGFLVGAALVVGLRRGDVPLLQPPQPPEVLLPGLSGPARYLLRLSDTGWDEERALQGLARQSFRRNLVMFLVLMLLGKLLFSGLLPF